MNSGGGLTSECGCVSGSALAASVCKKITGRLTSAIAKQEDVSVQLEALDIMADMLCRYPSVRHTCG